MEENCTWPVVEPILEKFVRFENCVPSCSIYGNSASSLNLLSCRFNILSFDEMNFVRFGLKMEEKIVVEPIWEKFVRFENKIVH